MIFFARKAARQVSSKSLCFVFSSLQVRLWRTCNENEVTEGHLIFVINYLEQNAGICCLCPLCCFVRKEIARAEGPKPIKFSEKKSTAHKPGSLP
ncbi:hypothetical protein SAMN05444266_104118 [Chitinophaga jiangningensis]|uniref:Uncharacterized protein n=1 Tax=Chitinophaga jiangningensis TaxID=1419482 RepID=A0A1M7BYR4_9BACT|nr:hypothetical protein SAMN05444266_104118 [Chitinophaga jiangningensis]